MSFSRSWLKQVMKAPCHSLERRPEKACGQLSLLHQLLRLDVLHPFSPS